MKFLRTLSIILAIACVTIILSTIATTAAELPCLQCHKSKDAGKVVHAAIGMGCSMCHGAPHAEEKPALSLNSEMPELCFACHDGAPFMSNNVHAPVAGGMCTSCHNPHTSDAKALLPDKLTDACYRCHDEKLFTNETIHSPVADGQCATCHSPHSSANARLLTMPTSELCAMCHPDRLEDGHVLAGLGYGTKHPVAGKPDPSRPGHDIECISCHNPHSTDTPSLLLVDNSKQALCTRCHKKGFLHRQ